MKLHPEIRSVVTLTHAHAHKVYMSGPLVRRVERLPDGHHPIKDEGWRDVWAQLGGTTLSIWDMREIDEASKQGKEVPPTYINVTDAVSLYLPQLRCHLTFVLVCASTRRRHDTRVVIRNPRSEIQ
jgi:CCR4-NOT transcriptional complex subunit CAF120